MRLLTLLFVFSHAWYAVIHADDLPDSRPNILIILADDLGYGDLQSYNPERGKIPTPNLDRLAAGGMRFTDAHSSSGVCTPSRYTLLTGRYHWRTELQSGIVNPFGKPLIAPDRLTIAGLAKQNGYKTSCIGKWHLGWDWPIAKTQNRFFAPPKVKENTPGQDYLEAWRDVFSKSIPGGPTDRGFDEYFGTDVPNWPPYCFIENDRTVGIPDQWLPDHLVTGYRAKEEIPELVSAQGPAVEGWNLEAILPTLTDRTCSTIEKFAKNKDPFLIYMALTSPHEPLAVSPEWKGKSGINYYADFVMETDAAVGRMMDALEKSGIADNTLVIFSSDNGKAPRHGSAELRKLGHESSGPFRGAKGSFYEGGHRMPFIVRWPNVVKPAGVSNQLVHQADVMATLADIFGKKLPEQAGEDSFSFLPILKGSDQPVRDHAVSCAADGTPGVRLGLWKLIPLADPKTKTPMQLFNLEADPGESNNLAAQEPERVSQILAMYDQLIENGRSNPGQPQPNDAEVRRYP